MGHNHEGKAWVEHREGGYDVKINKLPQPQNQVRMVFV